MPTYDDEETNLDELENRHGQPPPEDNASSEDEQDAGDDLNDLEENTPAEDAGEVDQPDEAEDNSEPDTPFKYEDKGGKKKGGKLKGKLKKKLFIAMAAAGTLIIVMIVVLITLFNMTKIIQLAENITTWNMVRSAREFRRSASQAVEESIAAETADAGTLARLKARFGESKVGQAYERFNKTFRPNKMFKILSSNMENVFAADGSYRGLRIGDVFIEKADTRFFHPIENYRERIRFAAETDFAIQKEMQGTSSFVRNRLLKNVLDERGINLKFWQKKGELFKGKSQAAAEVYQQGQIERENAAIEKESGCKIVKQVCEGKEAGDKAAKEAIDEEVKNETGDARTVNNKVSAAAGEAVTEELTSSKLRTAINATSLIYTVVVPACLIYEGSIVNSQEAIDNNEDQLERIAFDVREAADQQKSGETTPEAVAAFSGKLGNINNSIPERRASGKAVDATAETSSLAQPQSTSSGTFGLADTLFGGETSSYINAVIKKVCPRITDLKTGIGLAVAEAALGVVSRGSSKAGAAAAKPLISRAMAKIGETISFAGTREAIEIAGTAATKSGVEAGFKHLLFKAPVSKFVIRTGLFVGATIGATELAKMAVIKYSGVQNNGLGTDEEYANQADMGMIIYNNQVEKTMLYGRPLTTPEVTDTKLTDAADIRTQNSQKSFTQRYFAMTNPSSLISRLSSSLATTFSKPSNILSSLLGSIGRIFSTSKNSLLGLAMPEKAMAASTISGAGDYNIVQWGWSNEEESLINNNPDYFPLMNDLILDESGRKGEVEDEYGDCYTKSNGELFADLDIERADDGRVIADKGHCSPKNLGIHNDSNKNFGDLVFRWRLSKRNEATFNHLVDIQNASAVDDSALADYAAQDLETKDTDDMTCPISNTVTDAGVVTDAYTRGKGPFKTRMCWVQVSGKKIMFNVLATTRFDSLFRAFEADGYNLDSGNGDGYRTYAQQEAKYNAGQARNPATNTFAPPGKSNHQYGAALDVKCSGGGTPYVYGGQGDAADRGLSYFLTVATASPCLNWIHKNSYKYGLLLSCDGKNDKGLPIAGGGTGACEPWHLSPTGG